MTSRESRSPVHFVDSQAESTANAADRKHAAPQESEASEASTYEETGSESDESESESESDAPTEKDDSQTRRTVPPPAPSQAPTSRAASVNGQRKPEGSDDEVRTQHQIDVQLSSETPRASNQSAKAGATSTESGSESDSGSGSESEPERTPQSSYRPAGMEHLPSLKSRTAAALQKKEKAQAEAKRKGLERLSQLNEQKKGEANEEEEESESESDDDDDDESSSGESDTKPAAAKKKKSQRMSFGELSKQFKSSQGTQR